MTGKPDHRDDLILSRAQVRACDGIAIERFGITGLVLMENAGSAAARHILALLHEQSCFRVAIIAGTGNNAGDGFVVARHLANVKVDVDIVICGSRERIKGDALSNLAIIEKMDLPIGYINDPDPQVVTDHLSTHLTSADIIIDALLGTGAAGPPRQPIRAAIEAINESAADKTIVALDIPSGLDCDTGRPLEIAVCAQHTITFAALKKGFMSLTAAPYTGTVTVASIGIDTTRLQPN